MMQIQELLEHFLPLQDWDNSMNVADNSRSLNSYEIYCSGGVFHSDPNHMILVLNWITIRIQEFF